MKMGAESIAESHHRPARGRAAASLGKLVCPGSAAPQRGVTIPPQARSFLAVLVAEVPFSYAAVRSSAYLEDGRTPGLCWRLPWPTPRIALGPSSNLLNLRLHVRRPPQRFGTAFYISECVDYDLKPLFPVQTPVTVGPAAAPNRSLPAHLL